MPLGRPFVRPSKSRSAIGSSSSSARAPDGKSCWLEAAHPLARTQGLRAGYSLQRKLPKIGGHHRVH